MIALSLVVTARVAQLQMAGEGATIATERRQVLSAARGDLLDRTGQPLAVNDSVGDVFIDAIGVTNGLTSWGPNDKAALQRDLDEAGTVLGLTTAEMTEKVASGSHWVSLKKGVPAADARRVRDMKQTLITVNDRPRRVYPDGDIVRGLVGSVQVSNTKTSGGDIVDDLTGRSGLEKLLDKELTGIPGELLTERGPGNREIPSPNRRLVPSKKGTSFVLSVDRSLQYQTEENLRRALLAYGAVGGYVGVMDVESGDLLASVAMRVNPETGLVESKGYNAGVIDTYEPGSTMKPFTMAAALDSGTVTPESRFNVQDHLIMKFRKEQKRFKDDTPHKEQYWSVRDILVNSSNVGTITVARKLGPEAVNANLKQFGFGAKTGIADPKSESPGIMRDVKDWSGVDIGTVPIGQGISVSPVQMLAAMNSLAADGTYVTPRLVTASIAADGTRTERPVQRRRVVRSDTAAEVRSILADVVRVGTGKRAAVSGYEVAGKTGTAQKAEKGRYSETAYVASFAGFFPAAAPKLSILVILDEPYEEYGGLTAAPVFADMVRVTAQRYRIAPRRETGDDAPASQVLVTPELRAVNDPTRHAVAPVRSVPASIDAASTDAGATGSDGAAPSDAKSVLPTTAPKSSSRSSQTTKDGEQSVPTAASSAAKVQTADGASSDQSAKSTSTTRAQRTQSAKPASNAQPTVQPRTKRSSGVGAGGTDGGADQGSGAENSGAVGLAGDAITKVEP